MTNRQLPCYYKITQSYRVFREVCINRLGNENTKHQFPISLLEIDVARAIERPGMTSFMRAQIMNMITNRHASVSPRSTILWAHTF